LVKGWEDKVDPSLTQSQSAKTAIAWMQSKFNATLISLNDDYEKFRINEALMTTYKLVWDDFCAWYLEMVKPPFGQGMDAATHASSVEILENLLHVLHPFMPFLTEEIWHYLKPRSEGSSICVASWPKTDNVDASIITSFDRMQEVVIGIRNLRKEKNIPNKEAVDLMIRVNQDNSTEFDAVIQHLCNIGSINYVEEKPSGCFSFVTASAEYFIPFTEQIDVEAEKKKIEAELSYLRGFLKSVEAKLNNERFVNNAPAAVLESERKKQSDSLSKIQMMEEQLKALI
jgi:valyl-tRNA synthetase